MTHSNFKQLSLTLACALALGSATQAARAQSGSEAGYLTSPGPSVTRSAFDLCWRAGTHPDAASINECNPKIVAAPVLKVVEVEPKAVEPTPAPVVVAVAPPIPPPPVIERVTLDADALFDFNRSTLRPAGRTALDAFAVQMKELSPETIMAVGHADRIGSRTYNQHLSESRVQAVKAYLVSIGVAADRVHTEGKGENQPVTKTGECNGASARVIACLQPDRRVELEVLGNRTVR